MKSLRYVLLIVVLSFQYLLSQSSGLSGHVVDKATGKPLADVVITIKGAGLQATSDEKGNFNFPKVKSASAALTFEKLGFKPETIEYIAQSGLSNISVALSPAAISIGRVTVTSTRFIESINDTPIPLELVDKDKIGKTAPVAVPDAVRNEPGLALVRDGIWGTDISIRGLSRQNIVTLVDGDRIETASNHAASLSLVDIMDVENVEVIKGGISSLYGTGATGGIVSITTKTPSYSEKMSLGGSLISSYNTVNEGGAGYLSLYGSDNYWYAKLSGTMRSATNTKTPAGTLPNSYFRDNNISAAVGVKPFEGQQLLLRYQDFDGEDIGIPGGKSFPDAAAARYTNASREMFSAEYKIDNLLPSLASGSVKYFYQKISRDVELKPNAMQTLLPGADHITNGAQLQTNWTPFDAHYLVAGVDYWQREYNGFRQTIVHKGTNTIITGDLPVPNSTYKSLGFYAGDEFTQYDNKLKFTIGGRYDIINITNDAALNPVYTDTNGVYYYAIKHSPIASFPAGSARNQSWSANFGILYSALENLDLTFNASHAFRSPVLEERFQYINLGGDIYLGNPNLKPEVGNFLDLGLRWNSQYLIFRANAFLNYFTDLVVDKPLVIDSLYQKDNIGKARIYGYEGEIEYNVYKNTILYGIASYANGKDTQNDVYLSQIPPFNGVIGGKYSFPDLLTLEGSLSAFATQDKTGAGELRTAGYTIYNFYLTSNDYNLGHIFFHVSSGVENIFNKLYRYHLSTDRGLIKYEPGRNVFFRVELHW